jgi:putative ABC transport system permease protein
VIPVRYNLRSLVERRSTSLMTVGGIALVAMIFIILSGFIGGLRRTILNSISPQNWIVLNRGVTDETFGYIPHDKLDLIRVRPEIAIDRAGRPLLSPEVFAGVDVSPNKQIKDFALLRGVAPVAYEVHRNMRLVIGRWPVRGNGEWVLGQKVALRHPELSVGTQFYFGRRNWTVVGVFTDHGSARESEIWSDIDDLKVDSGHRTEDANSLHAVLKPGTAASFKQAVESQLALNVESEADYYAVQTDRANQLRALGLMVAIALGISAIFAGMNTMYTAVARRQREIGVLRALGFSRGQVLVSFVVESTLIGLGAGLGGLALAIIVASATGLNGRLMSVGILLFSYQLTGAAISTGIIAATIIGVLGGLLPSWRAAHIRIVDSIREA